MQYSNPKYSLKQAIVSRAYYSLKPFIPRRTQIFIRRFTASIKKTMNKNIWPVDPAAAGKPEDWLGWPEEKGFALVLTHDVDTQIGHNKCYDLARLEMSMGFRSSFNFVAKRYQVSQDLLHWLSDNGFEIGVHGIYHDGKKFNSYDIFKERATEINRYLDAWNAVGFRAPSMHCNLEWIQDLDIEYDASTFDTDPFEPKGRGVRTIFPFHVPRENGKDSFIELPYTLVQDFTLFVILKEKTPEIWKQKLDWIAENGGMALINVHPDYMNFLGEPGFEEYSFRHYEEFLTYISEKYSDQYWHALPREMSEFWRSRAHK